MARILGTTKKKIAALSAALVVAVGAAGAGIYFYYGDHALPGTELAGQSVSGLTRAEVRSVVEERFADSKVTFTGLEEDQVLPLDKAGVTLDADKTVADVFQENQGFSSRVGGLFSSNSVAPVLNVDDEATEKLIESFRTSEEQERINGKVKYSKKKQAYVASPSKAGAEIDPDGLRSDLVMGAAKLQPFSVPVNVVQVEPDYPTEAVQAAADQANTWLSLDVQATDRESGIRTPDLAERVSWIKFESGDGEYRAVLDEKGVDTWVQAAAAETTVEPVEGVQNVDSNGDVLSVAVEGADGWTVTNAAAIKKGIVSALSSGEAFYGTFDYQVEEHPWTQRLIADGADKLAYPAAPGEKWIDINLSKHKVTAYEGAKAVLTAPMVSAAPQYPNAIGEYSVWAKVPSQTMQGDNHDGTRYSTPNVPWILYYHGGYALHGAYWRSQFGIDAGNGGSHGCINLPVDVAKELYDWANVGTKVVAHN